MSVGKASIKRAVSADKKTAATVAKEEVKEEAKVVVETASVKKTAPQKTAAKKAPAKAPAKKAPVKKAPAKATAPVKKAEPKAKFGAVALTEDLPYYLL